MPTLGPNTIWGGGNFPRLINQPVKVHMAGWTSDTYTLQRNGWQISVEETRDDVRFATVLRMALKHPEFNLYGLTNSHMIDEMAIHDNLDILSKIELHVACMATEIRVKTINSIDADFSMFRPIDAKPHYDTAMVDGRSLDDFKIFRPLPTEKEIIIPQESVSELLGRIHAMQDPKQLEIRKKKQKAMRKFERECQEYELETNIVAQIATIV